MRRKPAIWGSGRCIPATGAADIKVLRQDGLTWLSSKKSMGLDCRVPEKGDSK